jgi:7-cyano-7-deazaguanine synthase
MECEMKAVVLLSGGLDSATSAYIAKSEGYDVYALSFLYGQRHLHEISCAKQIAKDIGAMEHQIAEINLGTFGGSALTDSSLVVPKERGLEDMGGGIPVTYVPARNTVFLSFALAYAEVLKAEAIFIGVNALDYSGYPDCRPEYIEAFQKVAELATKEGVEGNAVKIHTPLISLTKGEIIKWGLSLGVDYGKTNTCYDPSEEGKACGQCDACLLRLKGFAENGTSDPASYV